MSIAQITYMDITAWQWAVMCLCAVLVGLSKTGLPGVGILNVTLLAVIFEAKASTGILLPMLAFADLFAVAYYRRHAQWAHILRLLPPALAGIAAGSLLIRQLENAQVGPLIGALVLAMLGLNYWRIYRLKDPESVPAHWSFAAGMGFAAGLTTQLANAAGPIMAIYLLAMRFDKNKFIGTAAWYFLILNWLKLPIFISEGRISAESLKAVAFVLPMVIVGVVLGIILLKKIPQKWFNIIVTVLVVAAAIKLIITPLL
jgi:uncharacterized protein